MRDERLKLMEAALEPDPLATQDHYTQADIEPWDYAKAQGWFEGAACYAIVKYISRWKHKDGVKDLKKAYGFLGELIKEVEGVQ